MLLPIPDDILRAQARERLLDRLLASLGVSAATVSACFAAYMVATHSEGLSGPGRALAAQEGGTASPSGAARAPLAGGAAAAADDDGSGLDLTPTGSISRGPHAPPPAGPTSAPLTDFAVRDGFDGIALVEAHGTLQVVRPGTVLPGAGEVLAVTRTDRGWVVSTAGGAILQRH